MGHIPTVVRVLLDIPTISTDRLNIHEIFHVYVLCIFLADKSSKRILILASTEAGCCRKI